MNIDIGDVVYRELALAMCKGHFGALKVFKLVTDMGDNGPFYALLLFLNGYRGIKLWLLYSDTCKEDMETLKIYMDAHIAAAQTTWESVLEGEVE